MPVEEYLGEISHAILKVRWDDNAKGRLNARRLLLRAEEAIRASGIKEAKHG